MVINKEDYEEPRCILCMNGASGKKIIPVDTGRIIRKLDEYLDEHNWAAAEKHLSFWNEEAVLGNDLKGQLSIQNEIMGLMRKLGKEKEALSSVKTALNLIDTLNNQNTIGGATAYVNCGTVYEAFNLAEDALIMYEKAKPIYEAYLSDDDPKLGSLYNNMAMALSLCKRYDEAFSFYDKALAVMEHVKFGEIECAITYLNMADLYNAKLGPEAADIEICSCLDKAQMLLDTPVLPHNGYYAFMAEKCIETFRYYGYFLYADQLQTRVQTINKQTLNEK